MKLLHFAAMTTLALSACKEAPQYSVIGTQGMLKFISIPEELATNREHYQQIADAECQNSRICILSFFAGLSSVEFPHSDSNLEAKTAHYNLNRNTGMDRLLLACRLDDTPKDECF